MSKPKDECEMCSNHAKYWIGHPPFRVCGTHKNMVYKRIGLRALVPGVTRYEIRAALGCVLPYDGKGD
jgi:hypothetical protein